MFKYVLFRNASDVLAYTAPAGCEEVVIQRKLGQGRDRDPNGSHQAWILEEISEDSYISSGDAKRAGRARAEAIMKEEAHG